MDFHTLLVGEDMLLLGELLKIIQLIGHKQVQLQGIIRENNGKLVKLEFLSWGADKKRVKKKLQTEQGTVSWVNPRYCEKAE